MLPLLLLLLQKQRVEITFNYVIITKYKELF